MRSVRQLRAGVQDGALDQWDAHTWAHATGSASVCGSTGGMCGTAGATGRCACDGRRDAQRGLGAGSGRGRGRECCDERVRMLQHRQHQMVLVLVVCLRLLTFDSARAWSAQRGQRRPDLPRVRGCVQPQQMRGAVSGRRPLQWIRAPLPVYLCGVPGDLPVYILEH